MDPLQVPLAAAALLLVPSGIRKVRDPAPSYRALRIVGLPANSVAVRVLGAVELVAAVGALFGSTRWWPGVLALLYIEFTAFVALALWRNAPLSSCGCFGAADSPPSILHIAVDAGFVAVGLLAFADPVRAPFAVVRDGGGDAFVVVIGALALAGLLYLALTRPTRSRATPTHPRRH